MLCLSLAWIMEVISENEPLSVLDILVAQSQGDPGCGKHIRWQDQCKLQDAVSHPAGTLACLSCLHPEQHHSRESSSSMQQAVPEG